MFAEFLRETVQVWDSDIPGFSIEMLYALDPEVKASLARKLVLTQEITEDEYTELAISTNIPVEDIKNIYKGHRNNEGYNTRVRNEQNQDIIVEEDR